MKFRVQLKDPEALYDACVDGLLNHGIWKGEIEEAADELSTIADQWFESGEYVTLEIDTELNTCVVVPVKEH